MMPRLPTRPPAARGDEGGDHELGDAMSGEPDIHAVDIEGALRIRLVDAPESAIRDLAWRLPGAPASDRALPTLEVRFVDELPGTDPAAPIGRHGHAVAEGALVIGTGPRADRPRSLLRFDAIPPSQRDDGLPALICERAVGRVPHLVSLANVALLGLGVLPLHASAVASGGSGIVMAGWRRSGKTEAMLALASAGAALVADEWTYVRGDRSIAGLPGPIHLSLDIVEALGLPRSATGSLAGPRGARAVAKLLARPSGSASGRVGRLIARTTAFLGERAAVDLAPDRILGGRGVRGADRDAGVTPISIVVLLQPTLAREPRIRDLAASDVVARMVAAHVHHRLDLLDLYWLSRYSAPGVEHPVLDDLAGHEQQALARVLDGVPCIALEHPIPFDLCAIRGALMTALAARGIEVPG